MTRPCELNSPTTLRIATIQGMLWVWRNLLETVEIVAERSTAISATVPENDPRNRIRSTITIESPEHQVQLPTESRRSSSTSDRTEFRTPIAKMSSSKLRPTNIRSENISGVLAMSAVLSQTRIRPWPPFAITLAAKRG
jgi:hypothetical protein